MNSEIARRVLGKTGLTVPLLGLGCGTFGREISESEAFDLMDYACASGITLFDTAEAYGGGQSRARRRQKFGIDDVREVSDEMHSSELIVGRWIKSRGLRDTITLVTKVTRDFSPPHVRAALEASLSRLQTDHVDLYLYHSFDPTTPVDDAVAAMNAVIGSGLTRAGGVSNYSAGQLQDILAASGGRRPGCFGAAELCCNLLRADESALKLAHREQVGTLAYSPLAAGFLAGKYSPDRSLIPKGTRFDIVPEHADLYFSERNFGIVNRLHALALEHGVPATRLALAWVCRHPLVTTVLVGARQRSHLENALEATRMDLQSEWMQILGERLLPVGL